MSFKDIEDIDFQSETDKISARWSGFYHPHSNVTFTMSVGSTKGGTDVVNAQNVGTNTKFTLTGLSLTNLQVRIRKLASSGDDLRGFNQYIYNHLKITLCTTFFILKLSYESN